MCIYESSHVMYVGDVHEVGVSKEAKRHAVLCFVFVFVAPLFVILP